MKKLTFLFMCLFISLGLFAAPLPAGNYYIPNDPGNGATYYSNLTAAFTAINDNGIDGDINLYINGDITQTTNVGLINTSEHTITIRPVDDNDYTITFDHAIDDNAGPSGAWIIGIKMSLAWADLTSTKNIVIDGFADGGTTRRLKIMTADTHHAGNMPFVLINDCSNIVIKNTIIEHKCATSGTSGYGIYFRANTAHGVNKMPSDILIENNHITAVKNSAFQGIGFLANGATTGAANVKIKDNVIIARTRGIFLNYANGIEITGNEISVKQTNASTLSSGIMGNSGLSGDIIVSGNKFKELNSYNSNTGDYGMKGIIGSGGGTWYIDNNFFAGLDKGYGDGETKLQYIRVGSPCVIRNNTFHMKSLTKKPTANHLENPSDAQSQYVAISIATGTPEIKNNIFVSEESKVYNHFIRGTNGGDSNNNIFYFDGENTFARINSTHSTLAAYQAANSGKDVDSKFVEVNFANAATGDLSIAGASINDANLAVPRLATVLKDIFGTDRATTTYAGAHEAYFTKTFTVTVPSGTEHVYVAGSFSDKNWDISNPHELIATGNPNEYSGSFPCVDGVEYKYLNGKANWNFAEAKANGEDLVIWEGKPASAIDRSYNAADVVKYWVASPKVNLTVTISENSGEPSDLFVKGGWNGWTDAVALSKQNEKVFTGSIGNGTSDVIYSNTEYKYLTSQLGPDNWEQRNDNRWMIYPAMNDEISKFETEIPFTTVENIKSDIKIMRTSTGISVELDGNANSIELYNMKGVLMERAQASGSYTRDLESGAYILRINGVGHKFVR